MEEKSKTPNEKKLSPTTSRSAENKVKLHNEESEEAPGVVESQTAQEGWTNILKELPRYYDNIHIMLTNGETLMNWHRLSNGEQEFYGSMETDRIIAEDEVVCWQPPIGVTYPKYDPLTTNDLKLFSAGDIKELVNQINGQKKTDPGTSIIYESFNYGIEAAAIITNIFLERTLKKNNINV